MRVRVATLAGRQFGVVSRRQIEHLGTSRGQLQSWLRSGYLHTVRPRVYAVGHVARSTEATLTAAALYAGPGAMLSHALGVWWLGLTSRRPEAIELSTPRRPAPMADLVLHGGRRLNRIWHNCLPVAPRHQLLVDYAATADLEQVRRVLSEAGYQGWLDLDVLGGLLGRGRAGSATLRAAMADHEPQLALTRSAFERRLLALCRRTRLPAPCFNRFVEDMLVDAMWPEQKVIVELDGRDGHVGWSRVRRDRRRDMRLRELGYVILRYVWEQLTGTPDAVACDIAAALGRPPTR